MSTRARRPSVPVAVRRIGEPAGTITYRPPARPVCVPSGVSRHVSRTARAGTSCHRNGGTFYGDFFVEFAEGLARLGCPSVRANNRGHDIVNKLPDNSRFYGVAYDVPQDVAADYRAWIDWLAARGYRRIVLWGHSRGAAKTVHYQAHVADPRLRACILASPPWLSHARYAASARGTRFLDDYHRAEKMVAEGRGQETLWAEIPLPNLTGAACYVDNYGPDEPMNIFRLLDRVTCPLIAFTGTKEIRERYGFDGLDAELDRWAARMPNLTHVSIPDADHFYVGKKDPVLAAVLDWLARLPA
jgi:pimeloyl-ACP methyl ester carboxylesterase